MLPKQKAWALLSKRDMSSTEWNNNPLHSVRVPSPQRFLQRRAAEYHLQQQRMRSLVGAGSAYLKTKPRRGTTDQRLLASRSLWLVPNHLIQTSGSTKAAQSPRILFSLTVSPGFLQTDARRSSRSRRQLRDTVRCLFVHIQARDRFGGDPVHST